jgi:hypothetical protein
MPRRHMPGPHKRVMKRLTPRPRARHLRLGASPTQESPPVQQQANGRAWRAHSVRAQVEERRKWAAGTVLAFTLLSALLRQLPGRVAPIALVVAGALAFAVRKTVWRCPNCEADLPPDALFNVFGPGYKKCRSCGARLH